MGFIMAFDSLKFSKTLQAAGLDPKLADAHANLQSEIWHENVEKNLVTKEDLQKVKVELQHEIQFEVGKLENKMNIRFEQVDARFEQVDKRLGALDECVQRVGEKVVDLQMSIVEMTAQLTGKMTKLIGLGFSLVTVAVIVLHFIH